MTPLGVRELANLLPKASYKGWTMVLYEHPHEGPYIRFVFDAADAYDDQATVDIGFDTFVPPMFSEEQLAAFVFARIKRAEIHEVCEFFRWDGVMVFDPHQEAA